LKKIKNLQEGRNKIDVNASTEKEELKDEIE